MDFPSIELLLKIYGPPGIGMAILLYWNHTLRKDKTEAKDEAKEEREYSRRLQQTTLETLNQLENTVRSWLDSR